MFRPLAILISLLLLSQGLLAEQAHEILWNRILDRHLTTGTKQDINSTLLDYKALEKSQTFKTLLRVLEGYDTTNLITAKENKAFWINAYNITAVKAIVEFSERKSIRELDLTKSSIFDTHLIIIDDHPYTLNRLKEQALKYNDPRVYFALNTTALSDPDLRPEAYTASRLDNQLDNQISRLSQNQSKGATPDPETQTLYVSPVFNIYASKTKNYYGIQKMVAPFVTENIMFYQIKELPFDWRLNKR